jgi:hypothetical protein
MEKKIFIEIADRDKYDGVVIKTSGTQLSSRSKELGNICSCFNNKQIKQNEATPPTNTPTDGTVSVELQMGEWKCRAHCKGKCIKTH